MRSTFPLVFAFLILSTVFMTTTIAVADNSCGCCGGGPLAPAANSTHLIVVRMDVRAKALPHDVASLTAKSVKLAIHGAMRVPHHLAHQMQVGSDRAQVAFHAATGQTQNSFRRISAGVTSLSLQLLRGACSYFWALISGLLR